MKKIALNTFILLFTFIFSYSQSFIKNDVYEVMYSQTFQQPITLSYEYPNFKIMAMPTEIISNDIQYPEPVLTPEWVIPKNIVSSNKEDYTLPYHRGHLVPAKSFMETEHQKYIYSYLNCAIMHESLNLGVWKKLENRERKLSDNNKVRVKIILSFSDENHTVDGGATVPTSFTKIIEYSSDWIKPYGKKHEVTREVYSFPNDDSVKNKDLIFYKNNSLSGKFLIY